MAIEYNFTLDMDRSKRDNNIAYARTGDVDSITINADLVLNGAAYTPTGTNAFFECVTPNGHSVRVAASKSGSSVSVDLPSAAFQAAGVINVAYFRFETGGSDNPTYVESTEPFAIIVREGIGDNIDAGDYIEEWRQLADQLEAIVAEVEQKAEQAETAINEQKTEVDQLKAQAQKAIAGDVTEVEGVAQSAIAAINKEKADVADAAEDISAAGEQAINAFNSKGTSAINKFNTNANGKLDEVDGMITEAQGDVDAAITQLESETQNAIKVAQDALDGTTAGSLQNAINRTLKLDIADMTNIPNNASLSSFTKVGSYCCKTAAVAATVGDCPIDDSPFNMYVFSSSTSGQVMQLVVPIDLNGKPTAEWHVRFGTSSAMDPWSVIGGGADIAAGLGIDVTGDAKKTVALDTDAFYQHHEAASIIQGSTEVTGGGRVKELTVYGRTRQNLWQNPSGTSNGVTVTSNEDGSFTLSGTASNLSIAQKKSYVLAPGKSYRLSIDSKITDDTPSGSSYTEVDVVFYNSSNTWLTSVKVGYGSVLSATFSVPADTAYSMFRIVVKSGDTVSGTYRVMLNEGSEAQLWCPPGLNSVNELSVVCAGKNLLKANGISALNRPENTDREATSNGVTAKLEEDGMVSVSGTAEAKTLFYLSLGTGGIRLNSGEYTVSGVDNVSIFEDGEQSGNCSVSGSFSFSIDKPNSGLAYAWIHIPEGESVQKSYKPQLELGSTATAYKPPNVTTLTLDLLGHTLNSLPDGTRDELRIDATGAVTLVKRTQTVKLGGSKKWDRYESPFVHYSSSWINYNGESTGYTDENLWCDKLPIGNTGKNELYSANLVGSAAYLREPTFADDAAGVMAWMDSNTPTVIMPLATPQEIALPGIVLSDLASPDYTIYASSNVPAEIEAEVVKVDYLPASDVYTKEEVDKKIEDAGGMLNIVPVSQGGTGVATAAAERNRLGLGNTTGAVPIAKGGTGSTSSKAAQNSLLNDMNVSSDPLADSSMLVGYNASPSATDGAVHKRSVTTVWDYIASKVADKVWEQIKTKAIRSDTATGADLTLVGGLESTSQIRTSTLTLGANEMSLDNSNAAPLTVNGEDVITEGNISFHLPATFDAKSVRFSTPLKQGQQKNIITEGGFTLEELRKYFVPGNLVLANIVCGGDRGQQLDKVVPMVINVGDGKIMQSAGIAYDSLAEAHYDCIFAVANNEQAGGGGGTGLADGVTMLYSVTETPSYADRTSTSSLRGFTVFDLVSHSI